MALSRDLHFTGLFYLLLFQISMFFSAFYHLFCCHSEKVFHLWLSMDLAGISLGVCACYIPAVYYAFYCHAVSIYIHNIIAF